MRAVIIVLLLAIPVCSFGQRLLRDKTPERGYPGWGVHDEYVVWSPSGRGGLYDWSANKYTPLISSNAFVATNSIVCPPTGYSGINSYRNLFPSLSNRFTVAGWFKFKQSGNQSLMMFDSRFTPGQVGSCLLWIQSYTSYKAMIYTSTGNSNPQAGGTTVLNDTNAHFLAATCIPGTNLEIFVDGKSEGRTTPTGLYQYVTGVPTNAAIGFSNDHSTTGIQTDTIWGVTVWYGVALTTNEVRTVYENSRAFIPQ